MRCYFLHDSHIVGVAMLPPGLSERVRNRARPRTDFDADAPD